MTAPSPTIVGYEFDADVRTDTGWQPLPVIRIDPSVNKDRRTYATATLTLDALDRDTFALLDPRDSPRTMQGQVRWRIRQVTPAGDIIGHLPRVGATTGDYAIMHVRTAARTIRDVTIELSGREALANDKLCIHGVPATYATPFTVAASFWMLDVFGVEYPVNAQPGDTAAEFAMERTGWADEIPAGSPYLPPVEASLNAYDCRLLDLFGTGWWVADRAKPPTYDGAPTVVKLGAYTTDDTDTLPDDVDPIILEVEDTLSRDGDWADAVLVRTQYTEDLFTNVTRQQLAHQTIHSRGLILDLDHVGLLSNTAASIAGRSLIRGRDLRVVARARFDVLPGMELQVFLRGEILSAQILSVDWNLSEGIMSIHAQSAVTVPVIEETHDTRDRSPSTAGAVLAEVRAISGTPEYDPRLVARDVAQQFGEQFGGRAP